MTSLGVVGISRDIYVVCGVMLCVGVHIFGISLSCYFPHAEDTLEANIEEASRKARIHKLVAHKHNTSNNGPNRVR